VTHSYDDVTHARDDVQHSTLSSQPVRDASSDNRRAFSRACAKKKCKTRQNVRLVFWRACVQKRDEKLGGKRGKPSPAGAPSRACEKTKINRQMSATLSVATDAHMKQRVNYLIYSLICSLICSLISSLTYSLIYSLNYSLNLFFELFNGCAHETTS